jgi:hypothetical protein
MACKHWIIPTSKSCTTHDARWRKETKKTSKVKLLWFYLGLFFIIIRLLLLFETCIIQIQFNLSTHGFRKVSQSKWNNSSLLNSLTDHFDILENKNIYFSLADNFVYYFSFFLYIDVVVLLAVLVRYYALDFWLPVFFLHLLYWLQFSFLWLA